MPSALNRDKFVGFMALSAVGLALVVHDWCHPGRRTALPGLSLLIIGAVGAAAQPERREHHSIQPGHGQADRGEGSTRHQDEVQATEPSQRPCSAMRTEIYAEAVAETLHALRNGALPLLATGTLNADHRAPGTP